MAARTRRSAACKHRVVYALMLPPEERRYVWSPVWVRDQADRKLPDPEVVALPAALEAMRCQSCRGDMVLSHVEVLAEWTELARDLLHGTVGDDPRRDDIGHVLVFFAAQLAKAIEAGLGAGSGCEPQLFVMAMAAVTDAMVVSSSCFAQSFSKRLALTA
jgi:hypothetical protein